MKVLQVIDTLNTGGAERMTVLISNLLKAKAIDVSVLILVEKGDLFNTLDTSIPVVFLNRKKRFDIKKLKQTAKLLDDFDVVHVHLKHNFRYVSLASKYFSKQTHKLVFHDHSHYFGISKFSFRYVKDGLFKSVFKPNYFIGVSQGNCDWARSELNLPEISIFLLENTINKQSAGIGDSDKNGLVMVANISRVKQIEFAIKLAHHLNENLTIYGNVRDASYFEELKDVIGSLNYTEHITFIHNCNNIQPELHKYNYAIHTSFQETGPLVIIEYLAQSLPFLASATGQVFDILKTDLADCFVSNFELGTWASKFKNLSRLDSKLLEKAYNTYFSSDNYIKKCLGIYQKILSS